MGNELKKKRLQVPITPSELDEVNKVADSFGIPTSTFVLAAVRQAMKDGITLGKSYAPKGQSLALSN